MDETNTTDNTAGSVVKDVAIELGKIAAGTIIGTALTATVFHGYNILSNKLSERRAARALAKTVITDEN